MYHCYCGKFYRENERDIFIAQPCLQPTHNTAVSYKCFLEQTRFSVDFSLSI